MGLFEILVTSVPLALILVFDRKNIRTYLTLGLFAIPLAAGFEEFMAFSGVFVHHLGPKLVNVAWETILLYFHYLVYSYFLGNWIRRRF